VSNSDEDFGCEILRINQMDPVAAEERLRVLLREAMRTNSGDRARSCRRQLAMLLDSEGRRREALLILTQVAKETPDARSLTSLGCALQRYGWSRFAQTILLAALERPDGEGGVRWHDLAQVGLKQITK